MSGTITWNIDRMKQLHDARESALAKRESSFEVKIDGQGTHRFDTGTAKQLLEHLATEFTVNKPETYPENREGKEP